MSENSLPIDTIDPIDKDTETLKPFSTANYLKQAEQDQLFADSDSATVTADNSHAIELVENACTMPADRSPYLVQRLLETKEQNLFNHVKFNLVKQEIDKLALSKPRIVDIGCGLQVAHSYLAKLELDCDYFGVDYEPNFHPDAVVDLLNFKADSVSLPWRPDVLLMLDVLEHLHEDLNELDNIVSELSALAPTDATFIFTLPQMYRLDRFKLPHLHYPEHKIRLTQKEWTQLIGRHFSVRQVSGFGVISVIPYLTMASKRYRSGNRLDRLFHYLRGEFFEYPLFKPMDLALSKALGKVPWVNSLTNDIMIVAKPKRA